MAQIGQVRKTDKKWQKLHALECARWMHCLDLQQLDSWLNSWRHSNAKGVDVDFSGV